AAQGGRRVEGVAHGQGRRFDASFTVRGTENVASLRSPSPVHSSTSAALSFSSRSSVSSNSSSLVGAVTSSFVALPISSSTFGVLGLRSSAMGGLLGCTDSKHGARADRDSGFGIWDLGFGMVVADGSGILYLNC